MKKIVYLSPVDWRWIKQRPQFLAEELNRYCTVSVIYPWRNKRSGLQDRIHTDVYTHPYFTIPEFGGRVPALRRWNLRVSKLQIAKFIRDEKPDYLWLTMPWQIDLIPEKLDCPVVYDCMDDYSSISMQSGMREKIRSQEARVVKKAEVIFTSSEHLITLLNERYSPQNAQIYLLRNGYSAEWTVCTPHTRLNTSVLRIGYFGTIGRWFDFALIQKSIADFPKVEYHLYGPTENGVSVPKHPQIVLHGVVAHSRIPECAEQMDALVMPFVPNDIVQSVDPVKLYEYICLNKPIICIRYPEVERFSPFVMLYSTEDEYLNNLRSLDKKCIPRYTQQQAVTFLEKNSWTVRAREVARRLKLFNMED